MNALLLVLLSATALVIIIKLVQFWSAKTDSTSRQPGWTAENTFNFIQKQEIVVAPEAIKEHSQKHEEVVKRILRARDEAEANEQSHLKL